MKLRLLITILLVATLNPATGFADTPHPPKLISVTENSTGPYKPGDVITATLVFGGGNPGIKEVRGSFLRVSNNDGSFGMTPDGISQYPFDPNFVLFTNKIDGELLTTTVKVSMVVSAAEVAGTFPIFGSISATDMTGLMYREMDPRVPGPKVTIVNDRVVPRGQIRPTKIKEPFTLDFLPNAIDISKTTTLELPRVTPSGTPIRWTKLRDDGCSLTGMRFPGDTSATLKFNKSSNTCHINVVGMQGSGSPDETDMKFEKINLSKTINLTSAPSVICQKGNATKTLLGKSASCPKGWKKTSN